MQKYNQRTNKRKNKKYIDYYGTLVKYGTDDILSISNKKDKLFSEFKTKVSGIKIEDCKNLEEISNLYKSINQIYLFDIPKLKSISLDRIYSNLTSVALYKKLIMNLIRNIYYKYIII